MTIRLSLLAIGLIAAIPCIAQPPIEKPNSQRPPTAEQTFQRADQNGDGFIDADEAPPRAKEMLPQLDADKDGRISLSEFIKARGRQPATARGKRSMTRPGEFTAPAAKTERNPEILKAGDMAPEFTLPRVDGTGTLSLAELRREKPVVLVFGSISCSPFRRQVQAVEKLYQQYQDRIHFVMIYIREAHPDSEIFVKDGQGNEVLKTFTQTDELGLRKSHAEYCDQTLALSFPMLMDSVDNQTNVAYSGWPIRLVVVGTDGRVISPGAQGPQGFDPQAVAKWASDYTRNRQAVEH